MDNKKAGQKVFEARNSEQIGAGIAQNMDSYMAGFDKAFSKALETYRQLQEESLKPDLRHVYVCFLRSSISQQLPLLRIDIYGDTGIEDLDECSADWDVPFSKEMYRRMPLIDERFPADKGHNHAAEKVWDEEAELFFVALKGHMPKITEESRKQLPPEVAWHYGEYMDLCGPIADGQPADPQGPTGDEENLNDEEKA